MGKPLAVVRRFLLFKFQPSCFSICDKNRRYISSTGHDKGSNHGGNITPWVIGKDNTSVFSTRTIQGDPNSKPLHASASMYNPSSSNMEVYTDASEIAAAGYWNTYGKWFIYRWPDRITLEDPGIAWMEFFAIVLAARLWGSKWSNRDVTLKTDSQSSRDAWHHGHFHSKEMETLRKKLNDAVRTHRFNLTIAHIHSSDNVADPISRDRIDKFQVLLPEADKTPTLIPHHIVDDLFPKGQ